MHEKLTKKLTKEFSKRWFNKFQNDSYKNCRTSFQTKKLPQSIA